MKHANHTSAPRIYGWETWPQESRRNYARALGRRLNWLLFDAPLGAEYRETKREWEAIRASLQGA